MIPMVSAFSQTFAQKSEDFCISL